MFNVYKYTTFAFNLILIPFSHDNKSVFMYFVKLSHLADWSFAFWVALYLIVSYLTMVKQSIKAERLDSVTKTY